MLRILKYGDYNSATCSDCNCEFAFDLEDVHDDDKVRCPCCGEDVTVTLKPDT